MGHKLHVSSVLVDVCYSLMLFDVYYLGCLMFSVYYSILQSSVVNKLYYGS